VVAALSRRFGDLDIAQDAAAEGFATAVQRWRADGVPPNPGAWLTTTANRKAIDRILRENKSDIKRRRHRRRPTPADPDRNPRAAASMRRAGAAGAGRTVGGSGRCTSNSPPN
jgi:predicted RNA polymerase sigma factor